MLTIGKPLACFGHLVVEGHHQGCFVGVPALWLFEVHGNQLQPLSQALRIVVAQSTPFRFFSCLTKPPGGRPSPPHQLPQPTSTRCFALGGQRGAAQGARGAHGAGTLLPPLLGEAGRVEIGSPKAQCTRRAHMLASALVGEWLSPPVLLAVLVQTY